MMRRESRTQGAASTLLMTAAAFARSAAVTRVWAGGRPGRDSCTRLSNIRPDFPVRPRGLAASPASTAVVSAHGGAGVFMCAAAQPITGNGIANSTKFRSRQRSMTMLALLDPLADGAAFCGGLPVSSLTSSSSFTAGGAFSEALPIQPLCRAAVSVVSRPRLAGRVVTRACRPVPPMPLSAAVVIGYSTPAARAYHARRHRRSEPFRSPFVPIASAVGRHLGSGATCHAR